MVRVAQGGRNSLGDGRKEPGCCGRLFLGVLRRTKRLLLRPGLEGVVEHKLDAALQHTNPADGQALVEGSPTLRMQRADGSEGGGVTALVWSTHHHAGLDNPKRVCRNLYSSSSDHRREEVIGWGQLNVSLGVSGARGVHGGFSMRDVVLAARLQREKGRPGDSARDHIWREAAVEGKYGAFSSSSVNPTDSVPGRQGLRVLLYGDFLVDVCYSSRRQRTNLTKYLRHSRTN